MPAVPKNLRRPGESLQWQTAQMCQWKLKLKRCQCCGMRSTLCTGGRHAPPSPAIVHERYTYTTRTRQHLRRHSRNHRRCSCSSIQHTACAYSIDTSAPTGRMLLQSITPDDIDARGTFRIDRVPTCPTTVLACTILGSTCKGMPQAVAASTYHVFVAALNNPQL